MEALREERGANGSGSRSSWLDRLRPKGRVELHGTHLDRLMKKMRRKTLAKHLAVNEDLEQEFYDDHNGALPRFGI